MQLPYGPHRRVSTYGSEGEFQITCLDCGKSWYGSRDDWPQRCRVPEPKCPLTPNCYSHTGTGPGSLHWVNAPLKPEDYEHLIPVRYESMFPMAEVTVPSFTTQCALSFTSLESAVLRYREVYKEAPATVFFPLSEATKAFELRYSKHSEIYSCLHSWVPIPGTPENFWGLGGKTGLFLSWGF